MTSRIASELPASELLGRMTLHQPYLSGPVTVSVVVPVRNEAGNILPLIEEIRAALAGEECEIIYVDDGSTDETPTLLSQARHLYPELRILRHRDSCGQSAAIRTGILAAQGSIIATLDGDGQNDPADLPKLLAAYRDPQGPPSRRMVSGHRVKRQDTEIRRISSRVANGIRRKLLGDDTPDTGCGLKVFAREAFLRLPYFDHMHRFLPALIQREGFSVAVVPVNHRPRLRGTSKYGIGNRLWVSIVDLFGVIWLQRRMRRPNVSVED